MTVAQPQPSASTTSNNSPLASTNVTGPATSGTYYNGQWYPTGTGPTANLTLPSDNAISANNLPANTSQGVDPVTGLPVSQYNPFAGLVPPNLDFCISQG